MKGKKIGILIVALMALSAFVLPATVSAAAIHELTAAPATAAWGDTERISFVTNETDWDGIAWCNLTDPNGDTAYLGGLALTVTVAATLVYANWSYIPNVPGTWTVTVEFQKTGGAGTIATHTTTFDQERTMISVARDINAYSAVLLYLVVGVLLIALLLIMVSKVADRTGKSGKKE